MNLSSLKGCLLNENQSESQDQVTLLKKCGISTVVPFSDYNYLEDFIKAYEVDVFLYNYHSENEEKLRAIMEKVSTNQKGILVLIFNSEKSISVEEYNYENFEIIQSKSKHKDLKFHIEEFLNRKKKHTLKKYILARSGNFLEKVIVDDIKYIEVDSKYLNIKTNQKVYYIRASLNEFAKIIPENFVRISQSAIINFNYLERLSVTQNIVHVGGDKLKISRQYKSALTKKYLIS